MYTFDQLQELFNESFDLSEIPLKPYRLYDPIRYSLSQGGKRMRPLLVLMACDMFEGDLMDAMNSAIAVRCFTTSRSFMTISWISRQSAGEWIRFIKSGTRV